MKYVLSVSKAYSRQGSHGDKSETRKYWRMYYIDAEGHVQAEKVNFLQALFYKSGLFTRRVFVCLRCGSKFMGLARKDTDILACPYCSD
jgi:hypothetical protein